MDETGRLSVLADCFIKPFLSKYSGTPEEENKAKNDLIKKIGESRKVSDEIKMLLKGIVINWKKRKVID